MPIPSPMQPDSSVDPAQTARSKILDSAAIRLAEEWQGPADTDENHDPIPSVFGVELLYGIGGGISLATKACTTIEPLGSFDHSWTQQQSQLAVYSSPRARQSSDSGQFVDATLRMKSSRQDLSKVIRTLCRGLPPVVDATITIREDHTCRVIHEYHLQRVCSWFMTPSAQLRDALVARFMESKTIVRTMYLGTNLLQALGQDSHGTVRGCIGRIGYLEQKITGDLISNPSANEIGDCLMAQLELVFLRLTILSSSSGYTLLQQAVPKFLQLVAADFSLYAEQPDGSLVVSFPLTLKAPRIELRRFLIYDTVTSFLLGVPPLVEYGYHGECDTESHGLEWLHGIPVTFIKLISQVNSWRAGSRLSIRVWKTLEQQVLAWQSPASSDEDPASVSRTIVQESWRQVVLIYVYMGMCGVSSHDLRVQASVYRIVQLAQSVADLPIVAHMLTHCIVAGLAARLEKHRLFFYDMLLSFKDKRVWFFRGPQFSQVLFHLWHNVGEGGASVMWEDYVRSRCAIVLL